MKMAAVLFSALLSVAAFAATPPEVGFTRPIEGIDFPAGFPLPEELNGKVMLTVDSARMIVPESAQMQTPQAGVDYPSDRPVPDWARETKMLVIEGYYRLPFILKSGQAGLTWNLLTGQSLPINDIRLVEKAVAGIDFPTGRPVDEFWVAELKTGERVALK